VVNYRLFELISTDSFMQGVVQIGDIGKNLEGSMVLAKNGRRVVQHAMENFKGVSLATSSSTYLEKKK
jgi:hypothetical protein